MTIILLHITTGLKWIRIMKGAAATAVNALRTPGKQIRDTSCFSSAGMMNTVVTGAVMNALFIASRA
jgi:hypothetical protein